MPTLQTDNGVHMLDLGADENRFSLDWLAEVDRSLDTVDAHPEPLPLITHGVGKFYSNGLDLDWMLAHPDQARDYSGEVQRLLARVLVLGVPTVAVLNGHAFGAGAMLAVGHDFRIMRSDRGYLCFPEVDIDIPFTPGMSALIQNKLTPAAAVAAMTTGRRFGGPDALHIGLVDAVHEQDGLLEAATDLARPLGGKNTHTLHTIKSTMFGAAAAALRSGGSS